MMPKQPGLSRGKCWRCAQRDACDLCPHRQAMTGHSCPLHTGQVLCLTWNVNESKPEVC